MQDELKNILRDMLASKAYKDLVAQVADDMFAATLASLQSEAIKKDPTLLTRAADPRTVEKARKLSRQFAEKTAKQFAEAEVNKIGNAIADAIAQGKNPRDAIKNLDAVKGLDSNRAKQYERIQQQLEQSALTDEQLKRALDREYNRLLKERKKTIAEQEAKEALGASEYERQTERGRTHKYWITRQNERVCPICSANEAEGVIPIDRAFAASGTQHQPAHVNCGCSVGYVPDNERAMKAARQMNERNQILTAKAKQQAEKEKQNGK